MNDYFTPNIKAEVILDTLLTPFVADILNKCLQNEFPDENVKLIAKEMSVCEETDTDKTVTLRGPKIDYVLEGENFVYLVELKTPNSSIDIEQLNRYNTHCSGKVFREALGDKLIKILNKYCENLKIESLNPNCFSFLDTYVGSNYTEKAIGYLKKHKKAPHSNIFTQQRRYLTIVII